MSEEFIEGGVTAAKGFTANGVLAKIKESRTTFDVGLIYSKSPCTVSGVFTQNRVKAECVKWTKEVATKGKAQAVIVNSGNANCCTGKAGADAAKRMAQLTGEKLNVPTEEVIVASTGVIGQELPIEKIEAKMNELVSGLCVEGHTKASEAIMTTDTQKKEAAVKVEIDGKEVTVGAMCKGSGMIHINMGTMLCFITTDAKVSKEVLDFVLSEAVGATFNQVSVDGDTSTNDSAVILANGEAGNKIIDKIESKEAQTLFWAVKKVCMLLSLRLASDGEGATRLVLCRVTGAKDLKSARKLSKEVIKSNLVKAAMFGKDANCGRVLCALGYSGADFNPEETSVCFASKEGAERFFDEGTMEAKKIIDNLCTWDFVGKMDDEATKEVTKEDIDKGFENWESIEVISGGVGLKFDEDKAFAILNESVVMIDVSLGKKGFVGWGFGCDLTYDYVKINGDYRT